MTKIHFLSDSPKSHSGFSNVCKNLATGLKMLGHDVSISGFQTTFLEYHNGIPVYPMATGLDEIEQLQNNIMKVRPDVLFYINDVYTDARKFVSVFPKTITYSPVEGIDIPNHMIANLNRVAEHGRNVSQCSYGYKEMTKAGIKVDSYIYHGFNPNIFYPVEQNNIDKESRYCYFKTEQGQVNIDSKLLYDHSCQNCTKDINEQIDCLFYKEETITLCKYNNDTTQWIQIEDVPISKLSNNINPSKKFMFLFVGANHMLRKKIERLLKAYTFLIKQSKQLEDRIHLHLHTNPISPTGIDLLEIANRFNIQNNLSFSFGNWSESALNILYNLADCQVSATSSEGFSLPVLEGLATGLPMVAPDCTSQTELIGDVAEDPANTNKTIGPRGLLARIQTDYMIQDLTYRSLVDEQDLAEKMKELFNNKKMREKYGQNSVHFAKNYTWEKICSQWDKLLREFKM